MSWLASGDGRLRGVHCKLVCENSLDTERKANVKIKVPRTPGITNRRVWKKIDSFAPISHSMISNVVRASQSSTTMDVRGHRQQHTMALLVLLESDTTMDVRSHQQQHTTALVGLMESDACSAWAMILPSF
jgi:hypothetical protein